MNLANMYSDYGYELKLPLSELRIKLTESLVLFTRNYEKSNFAQLEFFLSKILKYSEYDHRQKLKWYDEHIFNTVEHNIASLICDTARVYMNHPNMHHKVKEMTICEMTPETIFNNHVNIISARAANTHELVYPIAEYTDNMIKNMYSTGGALITPLLELLGFLFIVSGKMELRIDLYIHYYLIYRGGLHEKSVCNIKAPVNGKSPANTLKTRIEVMKEGKPDSDI